MVLAFRPATLRDVDSVVDLVEGAYRGDRSRAGWTTEADLLGGQRTDPAEVGSAIQDPSVTLLLALAVPGGSGSEPLTSWRGQPLSGCLLLRSEAPDRVHLGMFAVCPELQSRGLGSALLAEAERVARQRGASFARMTVIEQRRELLAWYERRGYGATGETQPFPYGNPRFGLPRREDLRFVVLQKGLAAPRGR